MLFRELQKRVKGKYGIWWYSNQLVPLSYCLVYCENGISHFVRWRQWFGFAFSIKDYTIKNYMIHKETKC